MKKILQLSGILVAILLLCFSQKASASHYQGGDLTYSCIAPGVYTVNMKLYRDCTGAGVPTTATLNVKSPGCNTGRNITMTKIGGSTIGNLYCPQLGPPVCSTTGKPNYEAVTFTATVTFTAAEQTCPNWFLSWSECCRPSIENLANASGFSLYLEAYVNLGAPAAPFNNSSPEFNPLNVPVPLVCYNQDVIYSINANEADGDSLSYELAQPLDAANTPIAYAANTNLSGPSGNLIQNNNPRPPYTYGQFTGQFAVLQGTVPPNYTITYPMQSVVVNWATAPTVPYPNAPFTPFIWAATPSFVLDALSGELRFRPSAFHAGTPASAGRNKYAVVVRIKEWRKVAGVMVNVGYIRRDILFIVEDCGGNIPPANVVKPIPPKYHATVNDTLFQVQTCNTTRVVLNFEDTADFVKITVDTAQFIATVPSGKIRIHNNNSNKVSLEMWITPLITDAGKQYLVPVRVEDDACPIKLIENRVYKIKVAKNNLAALIGGDTVRTVCLGESTKLEVKLERPDSLLYAPIAYTYLWDAAPGLNPADANKDKVTVTPTHDTRYTVRITNTLLSGCYDTTSVLVKVVPLPIISDIKVGYPAGMEMIPFGRSAKLTPVLGNANTNGYSYSWSPSKGLSDTTIATPIASPLRTTDYTLTVADSAGNCVSSRVVKVVVAPFTLPNIITPNDDKQNDAFLFLGILPNTSLKIYNRWGVLVKEYSSYDNSFKGEGVSDGTYYYIIQEPEGGKSYKGWFEIIRK